MSTPSLDRAAASESELAELARKLWDRFAAVAGRSPLCTAAVAAAINLVVACLFLLFAVPSYRTNDDVGMMRIASGLMTGEPSEYLVYTNVLIGRALKFLYGVTTSVNWYSVYLYGTHFLSMTCLLFVLLRRRLSPLSLLAYALLLLGFELRLLLDVQFTSTSIVAGACGMLLLFCAEPHRGKATYAAALTGVFLIVLSAMIREKAFYLTIVILLPLVAAEAWRLRSLRIPAGLCVSLAVALAAISYDHRVYERDPAWKEFIEYNSLRGRIHGYPVLDYFNQRDFFDRLGWSANDVRMFQVWFFADEELYSKENLRKIVDEYGTGLHNPADWPLVLNDHFKSIGPFASFAVFIFLLAWFLVSGSRIRFLSVSFAVVILTAGALVYLAMLGKLPQRVSLPVLATASLTFLYLMVSTRNETAAAKERHQAGFFGHAVDVRFSLMIVATKHDEPAKSEGRKVGFVRYQSPVSARDLMLAALALAFVVNVYLTAAQLYKISVKNETQRIDYEMSLLALSTNILNRDEDAVFVVCGAAFPFQWVSPLSNMQQLADLSMISLGWPTHSPHYTALLNEYSVDDIHTALYRRPNLYLISFDSDVSVVCTFLNEHYGVDVAARTVQSGYFVVSKLVEKQELEVDSDLAERIRRALERRRSETGTDE